MSRFSVRLKPGKIAMFKKVLVVAVIAVACPAFVSAQDFSLLFGGPLAEAGGGTATSTQTVDVNNTTNGSINIYSTSGFDFDAADLNFFSSNPSVVQFTGGQAFNPTFDVVGGLRFDASSLTTSPDGSSGNLFSVSTSENGINQALGELFDPLFDPSTGPLGSTGSFLLARVDYEIVGAGNTEFSLSQGNIDSIDPALPLPIFGNASLTVVPEPSSAIVLFLGTVAMAARRKRA